MVEQVEDIAAFKQTAVELLKDADLDPEHKKLLLEKLFDERNQRRDFALKQQESQASASLTKKQFWHNTPLVVALVGTITIGANGISSWVLSNDNAENTLRLKQIESQLSEQSKTADASREATKEEREFAFKIIERELAKSGDMEGRARVLLFLVRAGILNSLNREELETMAQNDLDKSGTSDKNVGIPPTLGMYELPQYDLAVPPSDPRQTKAATLLLSLAVTELNRDVDETASFEIVKKYWSAIPDFAPESISPDLPWSAAFIGWLIKQTGNPDNVAISAQNRVMWMSSVTAGIAFKPADKLVIPGDIIFIARKPEDVAAFHSGQNLPASMQTGVVYSVAANKLEYIAANIGNALRIRELPPSDSKIVGYVRLGTGPSGDLSETITTPEPPQ